MVGEGVVAEGHAIVRIDVLETATDRSRERNERTKSVCRGIAISGKRHHLGVGATFEEAQRNPARGACGVGQDVKTRISVDGVSIAFRCDVDEGSHREEVPGVRREDGFAIRRSSVQVEGDDLLGSADTDWILKVVGIVGEFQGNRRRDRDGGADGILSGAPGEGLHFCFLCDSAGCSCGGWIVEIEGEIGSTLLSVDEDIISISTLLHGGEEDEE